VVELKAVKLVFQEADHLAVCRHIGVMIAQLLHDLVYDQLGVASDIKPSDPQLSGDVQTVDKCLTLSDIVRGQKMDLDHIPHAHAEGEMKMSPALAPLFISDPSKYIV
jgi:hypothetical protein